MPNKPLNGTAYRRPLAWAFDPGIQPNPRMPFMPRLAVTLPQGVRGES